MRCYDRIGNRVTETRHGTTGTYQYLVNAGAGNTPILDQVLLGVGGTRDYTWDAAGHLEEVAAGANILDFGADAEGRLSGVTRTAAAETAAFGYDGRSFLRSAFETAGGSSSVEPRYDSTGLVHALRRQPSPIDPVELVVFFYLAGRPVAQLTIDGVATETWSYRATDHLGTPLLATDDTGSLMWELEPFGRDYQQDLPPCPPCSPGPTPVVDLAQFPTAGQRAASECRALNVDINCLQKAKAGCAGDPVCINAIDAKKGAARQDQQRFGCSVSTP